MTPAAIQAKVYVGVIPGGDQSRCEKIARDVVTARRHALEGTGWEFSYHAGSARPPQGAVLIGAVACQVEGECDVNLYVYPVSPDAMVLRDRCDQNSLRWTAPAREVFPTGPLNPQRQNGQYQLENRYQSSGWELLAGESYDAEKDAIDRAATLSRDAIAYGMVRVIDRRGPAGPTIVKTFSAGGNEVTC